MFLLEITIGIAEGVAPWLLLFLLIFKDHLRFSLFKTAGIILAYVLLLMLVVICFPAVLGYSAAYELYISSRLFTSTFHSMATALLCAYLVEQRITILLFFLLIIKNYLDIIKLTAQMIDEASSSGLTLPELLLFIATAPVIYLFIRHLLKPIADTTGSMRFWKYLWLIPVSFYFIFRLGIAPWYLPVKNMEQTSLPLTYVWFFVTFVTYYLILHMLKETLQYVCLKEEVTVSQLQTDLQKKQYHRDIGRVKEISKEITRPLIHLDYLARQNDCFGIHSYIQNHLNIMAQNDGMPICRNYTADTVLRHYLNLAGQNHIRTTAKAAVPQSVFLTEIELPILLGNLLENALQACIRQPAGDRFIDIHLNGSDSKFLLSIRNSFDGKIKENKLGFVSSCHDGNGLGTVSVKNIAEKYDGVAAFEYDEHIFSVKVLLQNIHTENNRDR